MSITEWHNAAIAGKVVKALKKNGFDAVYFSNRDEATQFVLDSVKPEMSVGCGGSVTVKELGVPEKAREKGAEILDHGQAGLSPEEKQDIRRKELVCDLFLSSTNAVTLDGCLVNVDGTGNRVAALSFGPKRVIVVAGVNKICSNIDTAFERIRNYAAPRNNKRLSLDNPCTDSGLCMDCNTESRICRVYSVLKKRPTLSEFTVVLVGESLGY
ncbi:MAG: lactate utilization protein [Syntrophaceticus sp.]|jgi:L-lactate utilization protein LutB|nr:lactate utilization protein [Syntrophaceticus sp.]